MVLVLTVKRRRERRGEPNLESINVQRRADGM